MIKLTIEVECISCGRYGERDSKEDLYTNSVCKMCGGEIRTTYATNEVIAHMTAKGLKFGSPVKSVKHYARPNNSHKHISNNTSESSIKYVLFIVPLIILGIVTTIGSGTMDILTTIIGFFLAAIVITFLSMSFKKVRPTERALIERLGKYHRYLETGFTFIIPFVDKVVRVNITEQMIDAEKQEIITKDRLNATVDAQVYFKVIATEEKVYDSQYNVNNYVYQIVNLAKTTLRNIIGNLSYDDANSNRDKINGDLQKILEKEAEPWGIEIVRTELKEIEPTEDVQKSMNEVIKAENTKKAASDLAQATETEADGAKRAEIKKAEGIKQATILEADGEAKAKESIAIGEAKAIKTVAMATAEKYKVESEALTKYFKSNAVTFKQLETVEKSLKRGSKFVIDPNTKITNVISDMAGVVPIEKKGK